MSAKNVVRSCFFTGNRADDDRRILHGPRHLNGHGSNDAEADRTATEVYALDELLGHLERDTTLKQNKTRNRC